MSRLANLVAVVTGGTAGIGKATALAFAREGAKVVVAGRRDAEGQEVVRAITAAGGQARFVRTDVTREAEVKALVEQTMAAYGRLDVAFNNAGVEWSGELTAVTEEEYRRVFDVNVWSVFISLKYEIPAMLKGGGGAIVNTTSVAGVVGMANVSLYNAAKHAVEGLTKSAALEYATRGIRVNNVAPAAIATDMADRFVGKEGEQRERLAKSHPIGRMGSAEEVAEAVVFLVSKGAGFVTGTTLVVDGGWTAQ